MRTTVQLFAQLRLAAGASAVDMELPDGVTLGQALEALYRCHPELREPAASCLVAVGLDYATPDRVLREGEEISLIPPVQGG